MKQKDDTDFIYEWAVWANLDSITDLELILLKGHLILDSILGTVLERNNFSNIENYSFYRKINLIETLEVSDQKNKDLILSSLKEINKLRNRTAHEFSFNVNNGEFEKWSLNILKNLNGQKFTKYTFRTKIVHSFSVLSKNILELNK